MPELAVGIIAKHQLTGITKFSHRNGCAAEQQRNKRSNHVITWRGRTMVVTDWGVALGINPNTLLYRIRRGWPLDRAMTYGVPDEVLLELANPGVTNA